MSTHTPGPWIACLDVPTATIPGHIIKQKRQPCVPLALIAVNDGCSEKVKSRRAADACLIAAAPDMLAVLHRIASGEDLTGPGDVLSAVRSAITKATKG